MTCAAASARAPSAAQIVQQWQGVARTFLPQLCCGSAALQKYGASEPVADVATVGARLADQRVVEPETALGRIALGQTVGEVLAVGDVLDPRTDREAGL